MTALTASELAQARTDLESMLGDLAQLQRAVPTSDGGGGQTVTWADVYEARPCRLSPAGREASELRDQGDRLTDAATHVVTFAHGTDVRVGDKAWINGNQPPYGVLGVRNRGDWELTRRALVRVMPNG